MEVSGQLNTTTTFVTHWKVSDTSRLEPGWAPEPVRMLWRRAKVLFMLELVIRPVV